MSAVAAARRTSAGFVQLGRMVASESSLGAVLALLQRLEESDSGDQELERTATEMRNILPRGQRILLSPVP